MSRRVRILDGLRGITGGPEYSEQEPMADHTSFGVGGPADYFVSVQTKGQLQAVLDCLREAGEPYFILGKGTNLLVGDRGYRGAVVCLAGAGSGSDLGSITVTGNRIRAGAGAALTSVSQAAREHSLTGLEFASGIPGSVGGALVMNAGAYGGDMAQVVRSARLLMPDGAVREWPAEDLRFSYRRSVLREIPAVALEAVFELEAGDPDAIRDKMQDFAARRRDRQPLEFRSAGSAFKRPEGHYAGQLIEEAGLRGYTVGDACVSEKHCGFVINRGHATAADIRRVISDVQLRVLEHSGVKLEPEVIFLGDF